ncbi:SOS response-associated peptidase [Roseibacillus ishigakijimensis]|nr:SOS response-associated peptidase [Roseibacillus ishigakijimensis]
MCGRYTLESQKLDFEKALAPLLGAGPDSEDFAHFCRQSHYNLPPSQALPLILGPEPQGSLRPWGTKVKVRGQERFVINARAESLWTSPLWRSAASSPNGRCLIPATGWYEWRAENSTRWPYLLTTVDEGPLFFGGLYSCRLGAFVIITTEAGPDVAPVHHRQPVLIPPKDWGKWLQGERESGQKLTLPSPAGTLQSRKLASTLVNSPKNQGPEVLE